MRNTIYANVDNSLTCTGTKGNVHTQSPMLTYPVPQKPWERGHINTLESPMLQNGFKYLLVAIDYLSRFCVLQPMKNKKAEIVASVIFDQIICSITRF